MKSLPPEGIDVSYPSIDVVFRAEDTVGARGSAIIISARTSPPSPLFPAFSIFDARVFFHPLTTVHVTNKSLLARLLACQP